MPEMLGCMTGRDREDEAQFSIWWFMQIDLCIHAPLSDEQNRARNRTNKQTACPCSDRLIDGAFAANAHVVAETCATHSRAHQNWPPLNPAMPQERKKDDRPPYLHLPDIR